MMKIIFSILMPLFNWLAFAGYGIPYIRHNDLIMAGFIAMILAVLSFNFWQRELRGNKGRVLGFVSFGLGVLAPITCVVLILWSYIHPNHYLI
jgi:hypothetical protein